MTVVLQVSDPHFRTHRPHVVQALLRFAAAQIERVELLLRQARLDQVRIVVVHQPALAARASDAVNVLRGAEPAVHAETKSRLA